MKDKGYLLIDLRDSPGVPPDLAVAYGFDPKNLAAGTVLEVKTFTCPHCNEVVVMHPNRVRPREYCARCGSNVCDKPTCGTCSPFLKVLDDVTGG